MKYMNISATSTSIDRMIPAVAVPSFFLAPIMPNIKANNPRKADTSIPNPPTKSKKNRTIARMDNNKLANPINCTS